MSSNDNEILSTPEIKLWIKQGSILDKDALIIKGRYVFDTMISPEDLLSLLNEERTQWDHTIMHQEIIRKLTDNMFLVHYVTEPALSSILPSDFIDRTLLITLDCLLTIIKTHFVLLPLMTLAEEKCSVFAYTRPF